MKKKSATKKSLLYSIILLGILSVGMLSTFLLSPNVRKSVLSIFKTAEDKNSDGSPLHSKTIKDNGDGTYTISLDVTGESEPVQTPDKKANVIMIMDISGSMFEPTDPTGITAAGNNQIGRYINTGTLTNLNVWRLYYQYNEI